MSMPKRYTQPITWPLKADYSRYLEEEILTDDNKKDYEKAKNTLSRIPKLGAGGIDELLLKLSSFINES